MHHLLRVDEQQTTSMAVQSASMKVVHSLAILQNSKNLLSFPILDGQESFEQSIPNLFQSIDLASLCVIYNHRKGGKGNISGCDSINTIQFL